MCLPLRLAEQVALILQASRVLTPHISAQIKSGEAGHIVSDKVPELIGYPVLDSSARCCS